ACASSLLRCTQSSTPFPYTTLFRSEAEAVLQNLEHALAENILAVLRVRLQDREDDVLLAGAGEVLEPHGLAELDEVGHVACLELGEIHRVARHFEFRGGDHVELLVVREFFPCALLVSARRPLAVTALARLPRAAFHAGAC